MTADGQCMTPRRQFGERKRLKGEAKIMAVRLGGDGRAVYVDTLIARILHRQFQTSHGLGQFKLSLQCQIAIICRL